MKTNCAIELTDQERQALANFIDGKKTHRLATRKEVCKLSVSLLGALIEAQVTVTKSVECGETSIGSVINDINKGGWSMLNWD